MQNSNPSNHHELIKNLQTLICQLESATEGIADWEANMESVWEVLKLVPEVLYALKDAKDALVELTPSAEKEIV